MTAGRRPQDLSRDVSVPSCHKLVFKEIRKEGGTTVHGVMSQKNTFLQIKDAYCAFYCSQIRLIFICAHIDDERTMIFIKWCNYAN